MQVAEIELYEILKEKIGDKEAKTTPLTSPLDKGGHRGVEYVEAKVEKKFEEKKDVLATKEDINLLKIEIEQVKTDMQKMKADIIKWMFIFWAGQIGALIAILQIFFRK